MDPNTEYIERVRKHLLEEKQDEEEEWVNDPITLLCNPDFLDYYKILRRVLDFFSFLVLYHRCVICH